MNHINNLNYDINLFLIVKFFIKILQFSIEIKI